MKDSVKIITTEQFNNWIASKPDDAVFNMSENYSYEPCGCLMVQFVKDHPELIPKNAGRWGCGYGVWEKSGGGAFARFEGGDLFYVLGDMSANVSSLENECTFGELRRLSKRYIKN